MGAELAGFTWQLKVGVVKVGAEAVSTVIEFEVVPALVVSSYIREGDCGTIDEK